VWRGKVSGIMSLKSCGICCAIFSTFAMIFLLIVSAVIRSGSDSIPVCSASDLTNGTSVCDTKKATASTNCLITVGIYFGFLTLSLVCIFYKRTKTSELQKLVEKEPQSDLSV